MPKKDFEEENTWLNDSICGHLQQNILQNPEALTGKSGKHIWGKHSDLNTDAWSMSNKWSKRMALIFAISVAVEAVCLSRAGRPPTFLQNQMQTSDTFTNAPWRTLHTKFRNRMRKKKKKNSLERQERKKPTHLHMYICTSSGKQISYEMDGQSCTTMLNSSWKPQGCFPHLPEVKHSRK